MTYLEKLQIIFLKQEMNKRKLWMSVYAQYISQGSDKALHMANASVQAFEQKFLQGETKPTFH